MNNGFLTNKTKIQNSLSLQKDTINKNYNLITTDEITVFRNT